MDTWVALSCAFVFLSNQFLHPILPGLLDCNPFRESPPDLWGSGDCQVPDSNGLQVTGEIWQVVDVLNESWRLLLDCQVHLEVSSQLLGYLFYFINASLFNSLMERGTNMEPSSVHSTWPLWIETFMCKETVVSCWAIGCTNHQVAIQTTRCWSDGLIRYWSSDWIPQNLGKLEDNKTWL